MAGELTRQNDAHNPAFSQQGQVDWVSLANHTVSFSVGVLSRLSKAGVDPLTVVVAKTLCHNMPLSPLGQKRVFDALSTLKAFSSFGQVIWFGFGVRHIVHELTGTEEGMTCIALSAALQLSYDSFFGAQVFRELSHYRGAPDNLLPSLHQWRAMLHVSAGVLSTSKFPRLVDGFTRILAPPRADCSLPQAYSTTPSALAYALCILSDVTTGRTAYCTFAGGIDCAWIAAVAEWLYCLPVEVQSENSSEVEYRTSTDASCLPQSPRVFIIKSDAGWGLVSTLCRGFVLPSGGDLIWRENERNNDHSRSPFERRSEWSHLLTDVFGKVVESLLQGPTGESFAYLLRHTRIHGESFPEGDFRAPNYHGFYDPTNFNNETFLEFAKRRLPELESCLDRQAVRRDRRPWDPTEDHNSIRVIEKACGCRYCDFGDVHYSSASMTRVFCLRRLAAMVIELLEILYNVAVDPNILPSHYGILDLYHTVGCMVHCGVAYKRGATSRVRRPFTVLRMFSGSWTDDMVTPVSDQWAAFSVRGLCAYYQLLEDPNLSPGYASKMLLRPGRVEHNGVSYTAVKDLERHNARSKLSWSGFITRPNDQLDFVVEETIRSKVIQAGYRIQANEPWGRDLTSSSSQFFAVTDIIKHIERGLLSSCPVNDCPDWGLIQIKVNAWTFSDNRMCSWILDLLTAGSNGEVQTEEQHSISQPLLTQQQRHSTIDHRRTRSWSVLVSKLFTGNAQEDLQEYIQRQASCESNLADVHLEIHMFPRFFGGDSEGKYSTPVEFFSLYAEMLHARRALVDYMYDPEDRDSRSEVLFGEFDHCAACLIRTAILCHLNTLEQVHGNLNGEVIGAVVWHLANGEEQSRTGYVLKKLKDEEASDGASETNSSAYEEVLEDADE